MSHTTHVNLAHAREAHQRDTMERIIADGVCPFCRENLERYHTKPILAEDPHWILTTNFAPYKGSKHHFLIISALHCVGFWELTPPAQLAFFTILNTARERVGATGGSLIMRWGDTNHTGASVSHLHAQLIIGASREEGGEPILTSLGYQTLESSTQPE
jgi:diadenosine tetraphosphate (Ap4A) HIT family hydrolase